MAKLIRQLKNKKTIFSDIYLMNFGQLFVETSRMFRAEYFRILHRERKTNYSTRFREGEKNVQSAWDHFLVDLHQTQTNEFFLSFARNMHMLINFYVCFMLRWCTSFSLFFLFFSHLFRIFFLFSSSLYIFFSLLDLLFGFLRFTWFFFRLLRSLDVYTVNIIFFRIGVGPRFAQHIYI